MRELSEWIAAREAIFHYGGVSPKEYWDRLASAEQKLMKVKFKEKEKN